MKLWLRQVGMKLLYKTEIEIKKNFNNLFGGGM